MISFIFIYTHTQHIKHVNVSYSNKKTQIIINPISKEKKKKNRRFFFFPNEIAREKQVCKILVLENKVNYNRPLKGEISFS